MVLDTSAIIAAIYALAKARSQPILFKGDDFTQTDIVAAAI